ncbi:PIG-L family deacetylase [Kitasatospora phosalacinea]|uniref:PIG-L family deacetylase n=1 Tax=Kitasatospora phosalacinea TaxID=2065 RepID=A0ABW6GQN6_9ACTN
MNEPRDGGRTPLRGRLGRMLGARPDGRSGTGPAAGPATGPATGPHAPAPGGERRRPDPGSVLQVVAHPDDDLYFINPDAARSVGSGAELLTVVLTAAEGDGRNLDTGYWARGKSPQDHAGYSAARHNGLRRAYARMAVADAASPWHREAVRLPGGLVAEVDTLLAAQHVRLCFLQTAHQVTDERRTPRGLRQLWLGDVERARTLPVPGSPVREVQEFDREQLVEALAGLMADTAPTVVRTLDPDPEHDGGKSEHTCSDHHEHAVAAQFTLAAVQRHAERTGAAPAVDHYRGYANRYWAFNLSRAAAAEKADLLHTYAGADGVPDPGGDLGDFQLGTNPYRSTHLLSTAPRHAPGTGRLLRRSDGTLLAWAVLAGRAVVWEQEPDAERWTGPARLEGGWLVPVLAAAAGPDGSAHLVGLRRRELPEGPELDLVHACSPGPGEPFGPWASLGNPDADRPDPRTRREPGVPAAAVDGRGVLHVFARDYAQGLSHRTAGPDGTWESLGGDYLQDSPVALTTASGRVEVYAPGKQTVRRWFQKSPGAGFTRDFSLTTMHPASGGITAVEGEPDRVTLYLRQPGTAQVMAYRQHPRGAGWPERPAGLGGHGGTGPVAALPVPGRGAGDVLLAHRNEAGALSVSLPPGEGKPGRPSPEWSRLGGELLHAPSAAVDRHGRRVLAVLGPDARLHLCRQRDAAPDSPFGPWQTL